MASEAREIRNKTAAEHDQNAQRIRKKDETETNPEKTRASARLDHFTRATRAPVTR